MQVVKYFSSYAEERADHQCHGSKPLKGLPIQEHAEKISGGAIVGVYYHRKMCRLLPAELWEGSIALRCK